MAIEVGVAYLSILPETSKIAPGIRKALGGPEADRAAAQAGKRSGARFGSALSSAAKVGILALGAGIAGTIASSVKLEKQFSQTMNVTAATLGAPQKEMAKLQKLALDLGASTSFSASEAGDAMLELAKGGLTSATIQGGALAGTLQLAAAGGTSLSTAAEIASNALNTFKLKGTDMNKVSAALAGGANASTASVESLGMALSQVGPGAVNAGLTLNDTVGALAAFDNAGIKGSDAGTSLKTMLTRLVPSTAKAATAMKKANLDFTDADGNFVSLTEVAQQLQDGLSGLSESQRTAALNTIFGSDATRAASVLMDEGSKGLAKYIKATKDSGAAQDAADARMKGTAGALERLSGAWETVRLRIGLALGPAVVKAADLAGVALDKVGTGVEIAASHLPALAAGFRDMVGWVKENAGWLKAAAVSLGALIAVVQTAHYITVFINVMKALRAATIAQTIAQWKANAAAYANPYVLLAVAVIAVVAALIWFFTQTKLGQSIVSAAWNGIKTAVSAVVDWFTGTALPALKAVWDGIVIGAKAVWTAMKSVWGFMKQVWAGIVITAKFAWTVLKVIFVAIATAFILMWKFMKAVWSVTGAPIFRLIADGAKVVWGFLRDKVFKPMALGFKIMALGFVLMYRRYILPAWNGIKSAASAAWKWVKTHVIDNFILGLRIMGAAFRVLWKAYVVPAWNGIKKAAGAAWSWIKTHVIDNFVRGLKVVGGWFSWLWRKAIKPAWNGIKTASSAAWDWIQNHVFKPFEKGIDALGEAFKVVKRVIKSAWNGIKKAAAGPVNFVIDEVYNKGIRDTWNDVADSVGLSLKLPRMDRIKGYATGGWTGHGSKYQPAGVVHADEFVVSKAARRRFERTNPGALDHLNRTGSLPGFAGGGLVPGASDWWRQRGAALSEHPAFGGVTYGGHMPGSLHYSGQAIDLNYRNGNETSFFDKWIPAFRQAFPTMGTIWRAPGHYNHAHIDTGGHSLGMGASGTRGGGGGIGSAIAAAVAKIAGLGAKIKEGVGNHPLGKIAGALGRKLIGGAKDKLSGLNPLGDVGNAVNKGTAKAQVRAVAALRGWGLGSQWAAIDWLVNKESGWDPKAANGTSSARGLFQKMTSLHGPVEKTAAGQARWGLGYIADNYGNPANAVRHHMANNWYADGGLVKPALFDNGGWLPDGGIGINKTGKPEAVLTPGESRALKAGVISATTAARRYANPASGTASNARQRVVLQVGTREFEAYLRDVAADEIEAADDFAGTTRRMH